MDITYAGPYKEKKTYVYASKALPKKPSHQTREMTPMRYERELRDCLPEEYRIRAARERALRTIREAQQRLEKNTVRLHDLTPTAYRIEMRRRRNAQRAAEEKLLKEYHANPSMTPSYNQR